MSDATKRPRTNEPPVQGGGFVTAGDDAWDQQDPDTWARMGNPSAKPVRPAAERRKTENGNGAPRPVTDRPSDGGTLSRVQGASRAPSRSVIGSSPRSIAPTSRPPEVARVGDDPRTVVGGSKLKPSGPPRAGVARMEGSRMEIVNFDGLGARAPAGATPTSSTDITPPPTGLDLWLPGHPPIRIVRRARREMALGRVTLSVAIIVAFAAFAWHRYDLYLESNVPPSNAVIFTQSQNKAGDDAAAADGSGSGSGASEEADTPGMGPAVGMLTVRSNRSATVYVDGRSVGSAPLDKVRIVMGTHEIKVVDEESLESRTQVVKIIAGKPRNVTISF